ncbi:MAG: ImuA family protein [Planctomycetaceae bacterium]
MVTLTATAQNTRQSPVDMPGTALVSGGDLLVRERKRPAVPTGFRPLDALLPAGGVRPGSLVEWIVEGDAAATGCGAMTLAFAVACRLAAADGTSGGVSGGARGGSGDPPRPRTIVVVDRTGWFHPPAVLPWLGDERRLVVARPSRDDDEIWTIDQALRCSGVAAVLAWPQTRGSGLRSSRGQDARTSSRWESRLAGSLQQWSTAMRRWQLAAAASGTVGLFVRPRAARGEPSWAESRIAVAAQPGGTLTERRLRLALVGGTWSAAVAEGQRAVEVVLDVAWGVAGVSRSGIGMEGDRLELGRNGAACRAS